MGAAFQYATPVFIYDTPKDEYINDVSGGKNGKPMVNNQEP